MKVTGEIAVRPAGRCGLPVHKKAGEKKGCREDIPLEDAQWILRHDDAEKLSSKPHRLNRSKNFRLGDMSGKKDCF